VESHEEIFNFLQDDINKIILSRQVDNATGNDLDRIGKLFGEIGKRRGRNDKEYASYLKSVVKGFRARGTVPDIKFALDNALFEGNTDAQIEEIYGEYKDGRDEFNGESTDFLSEIPIRDDNNTIRFYDETEDADLTVNFTTDVTQSLGTNEVNINPKTGEWRADSSSDYTVSYEYREMLSYQITLDSSNWDEHSSSQIIETAELTDASVSDIYLPITRILDEESVEINAKNVENTTEFLGLGSDSLNNATLS
jgi:hypothetical protein